MAMCGLVCTSAPVSWRTQRYVRFLGETRNVPTGTLHVRSALRSSIREWALGPDGLRRKGVNRCSFVSTRA
jgi:hypothetical protein